MLRQLVDGWRGTRTVARSVAGFVVRSTTRLAAIAVALLAVAAIAVPSTVRAAGPAEDSPGQPSVTQPTPSTVARPSTTINEFIPEDRDLSDCLSVLPKPGCGSEARGGPAQAAVFGAIVLGLAVIGGRIAWSVRSRNRAATPTQVPDDSRT